MVILDLGTDIAFNKPATHSGSFLGDSSRYGAQFAVNGQARCDTEDGPVQQTAWHRGWWEVDLQGNYYIRTVEIWPRTCMLSYLTFRCYSLVTPGLVTVKAS